MIKIKTLTIEIKENIVNMLVIEKYFGQIKFNIMKSFEFNQIDSNGIILDTEKLNEIIKNELSNFKIPCRRVSFAVQNESIINRNIKIINTGYKGDIKGLIEYELNEYMPINIKDYILKYKVLGEKEDFIYVQAILMPRDLVKNYKELSKLLKLKNENFNVNFDILNKLISNEEIELKEGKSLILDIGKTQTNVNLIENKFITNSYTLKNENIYDFLNDNLKEGYKKVYYYGVQNYDFTKTLNENFKLKKLLLKNVKRDDLNNFINNIGLV
ncbi:pilus assembly protein PilM [Paraclostridium ghonii]|uniref:Type IV pilus assembly protein PilM n=1 Tax=Paraclostridium ghonii TaxID=29358 RepID=A0ABU0N343_9FIRM|nr:pilus assembly protein PilM [Paeniclostridium ghonii]MDQ0557561.1 type IV pilus assembly protein PilM [Paeniclostridium ghonii]